LTCSIEDRDEHQSREAAGEGSSRDLGGDDERAPGALVRIGQMPLAPGTGGHLTKLVGDDGTIAQAVAAGDPVPKVELISAQIRV